MPCCDRQESRWRQACHRSCAVGGGARGAAHLGVLKVIEEMGIPVDVVVGYSLSLPNWAVRLRWRPLLMAS
ncbi:MAG TPA: hypothetical protein DF427_01160 [Moraxellaceae bacterium]|nr:hypothetical protein [Moraxellaceae bacterium]